jgi:hypothetical protein
MNIVNKNTNGTRTRAMSEREVMQELTPLDPNYGKVIVGTDSTYGGEVILAKDADVVLLNANNTTVGSVANSVKTGSEGSDFNNTSSGLSATTIGGAINEVESRVDAIESKELFNKIDATVAPSVTNDSGSGFEDGSLWIDTVANEAYRCVDASVGAAVWINTTLTTDELSALLISYNNTVSGLSATTVKGGLDELAASINELEQVAGTTIDVRYDKKLSSLDVVEMTYDGNGNLTVVRYTGDNDTDMYYRDVLTYVSGNLAEVKHYYGKINLLTKDASTILTYSNGSLSAATYTEV